MNIQKIAKGIISRNYSEHLKKILGDEVYTHSKRVCNLSLIIADAYNFDLQQKVDLATGALLHDIGKSYISQNILNKVKELTKDDRMIIECHPQQGYLAIKDLGFNKAVMDIVHYHHERIDGSGYPGNLRGNKISILTQIASVADVYEALTTKRVYHQPVTHEQAIETMQKDFGLNQLAVSVLAQKGKEGDGIIC